MFKENDPVGVISIYRREVRPFNDKQIDLVSNFAAQAVIAIENTRLLNELRQSLEQQTATAEVLRVISSSPGELEPVFQAMLDNATRICEARFGSMQLRDGDAYRRVALHNAPQKFVEFSNNAPILKRGTAPSVDRAIDTGQAVHIPDVAAENPNEPIAKFGDARTLLVVPMLKENKPIGVFGIYRQEVRPFADKQIALVQNFAAQAVIAIENTRLLNELRESLHQQTATADVLRSLAARLSTFGGCSILWSNRQRSCARRIRLQSLNRRTTYWCLPTALAFRQNTSRLQRELDLYEVGGRSLGERCLKASLFRLPMFWQIRNTILPKLRK
jgi:GAF domain-containing protein